MRRIPPALPLPDPRRPRNRAETAAHTAAATRGMPDFVFQQQAHAAKGSGQRELGDRLLLASLRVAVAQVKARTITPKPDALEAGWIHKVAAKAAPRPVAPRSPRPRSCRHPHLAPGPTA
ncbi:hypothetical protein ACR6C2_27055 [Streptomyces sp. INA 01156]